MQMWLLTAQSVAKNSFVLLKIAVYVSLYTVQWQSSWSLVSLWLQSISTKSQSTSVKSWLSSILLQKVLQWRWENASKLKTLTLLTKCHFLILMFVGRIWWSSIIVTKAEFCTWIALTVTFGIFAGGFSQSGIGWRKTWAARCFERKRKLCGVVLGLIFWYS